MAVPTNGSDDFTDHHAITAQNGANKILIRNNESYGHNGDSFQCGEVTAATAPVTGNVTVEGNRFHQHEENAIDLKACQGVTIRNNKMFGYRPACPNNADGTLSTRAPPGDAIVVHAAASGRSADRVLIELNRFWDNSRSINLPNAVATAKQLAARKASPKFFLALPLANAKARRKEPRCVCGSPTKRR